MEKQLKQSDQIIKLNEYFELMLSHLFLDLIQKKMGIIEFGN